MRIIPGVGYFAVEHENKYDLVVSTSDIAKLLLTDMGLEITYKHGGTVVVRIPDIGSRESTFYGCRQAMIQEAA